MNSSNFIIKNIWSIFWILGTIFTYFIWIYPEWNSLRTDTKLTNSTGINDNIRKFVFFNATFKYLLIRIFIILFCAILSAAITSIYWCSYQGKPLNTLYDVFMISGPIIVFYFLLCGVKNTNSESELAHLKIILSFKIKVLELFISFEKKLYIKSIHKKICKWYKEDSTNHKFAALIMRMSDKSFVNTLKSACNLNDPITKEDGAIKSILYEKPIEIMEDYFSNDIKMNVLTNIIDLVETYFSLDNCEPHKIMNFISNHDLVCKNSNKEDILSNIEKVVDENSRMKNKIKNKNMKANKFNSLFNNYLNDIHINKDI